MHKMPILDNVIQDLIKLPKIWLTLVLGSLLSFIPLLNVFAFGYLYQVFRGVKRLGLPALPPWQNWRALLIDGIRFTVVWFGYMLMPCILAFLISSLMKHLGLGIISNILLLSTIVLSNISFLTALSVYHVNENFKDLLNVKMIFLRARDNFPILIVPSTLFLGTFVCLLPLYGFGFFSGYLILLTYKSLVQD